MKAVCHTVDLKGVRGRIVVSPRCSDFSQAGIQPQVLRGGALG